MRFELADIRRCRCITQKSMAEKLGVPESTYRTWEYGKSQPSLQQLCKIADILDCSLDTLAGRRWSPHWNDRMIEELSVCRDTLTQIIDKAEYLRKCDKAGTELISFRKEDKTE